MSDEWTTRDNDDSGAAARARWLDGVLGDLPAEPAGGAEPELPWPSAGQAPAHPAVAASADAAAPEASAVSATAVRLPLRLPPGLDDTGEAKLVRIEITGVPPGAVVTPARKLDNGTYAVSPEDSGRLVLDLDPAEVGGGQLRLGFKAVAEDPVDGSVLTNVSAREIAVPRAPRPPAPATTASEPPPPPPPRLPDFAADLDISVGIDDPETLRGIGITILGVPWGGRLSAGEETAPGRWEMTADKLAGLTITVPGETGDFTLEVMLETGDGSVQSAEIGVSASAAATAAPPPEEFAPAAAPALSEPEPPAETAPPPRPQPVEGGSGAIVVRLGSEPYRGDPHYRLYADGRQIADGNLDWAQAAGSGALVWQDVVVPWTFETAGDRPAEIGIRFETEASRSGGAAERTLALGFVEIDGLRIPADAAEVTASEGWVTWHDADGMPHRSWNGELTIDVAAAFARLAPEGSEVAAAGEEGGGADVPSAAPEAAAEPVAAAPPEEPPGHDPSLLVIPAEERDLARPGFLAEIVELRNFVRAAAAGEIDDAELSGNRLYGRLGLDVGRWHDVALRDARGHDIPLDLPAPRLAPQKGRAFAQDRRRLRLGDVVAGGFGDVVEVSGVPPGGLLDVGENLGGGCWRLTAAEARHAHLLLPFGGPHGTALEAALRHGADGPVVRRHTLHAGRPGDGGPLHAAMHRVRLPLSREVFDPRRYGNVTLTLADVPPGALLSRGTNHGDGVWTVEGWEGERIALLATAARGRQDIHVTAMSFDEHSGETEIVARDLVLDPGHEAVVLAASTAGPPAAPR